jgi:hypothetical protein
LAAVAAALALVLTSAGDTFLLAAVLGLAAADLTVLASGALVAIAVLARWGTTSLAGLAGAQAVLGPAGWRGSVLASASAWCAAAALIAAAGTTRRTSIAVALGLAAGLVVAGPAAARADAALVRAAGAAVGVVLALVCARAFSPRVALPLTLSLGAAAVVLGVVA